MKSNMRFILALLASGVLMIAAPRVSEAQYQAQLFQRWEPPVAAVPADILHLAGSRPPNYGLAGGLIGGAIGVVLGALAGNAMKNSDVGGGDAAIVVVGGLGGLIGGLIGYGFGREIERHHHSQDSAIPSLLAASTTPADFNVIGTGTEMVRSSTDTRSANSTVLVQAPVNADHHFRPAYPASCVCRAMPCVITRSWWASSPGRRSSSSRTAGSPRSATFSAIEPGTSNVAMASGQP